MSTHLLRRFLSVGVFFSCVWLNTHVQANESSKVEHVLATEAAGKPIDRRKALADQVDEVSQWQSGRVLINGQWLDIEDMQEHRLGPKLNAYRQQRDSIKEMNSEGHRQLARWCQSHQMPEMASVHWKAVVAVEVDDNQAHKALRHKKIDNVWLTDEELRQAANDQRQEKAWLKEWMPRVRKIVTQLRSDDTQTRLDGMRELEKIDSVGAVAALRYGAIQVEPSIALPIVSKIKSLRSKNACLALCEIAIADPTSEIGRLAIDGLRDYDEHFYIPELLQTIQSSLSVAQQCMYLPNGTLAIKRAYTRETADAKEQFDIIKLVVIPGVHKGLSGPSAGYAPSDRVETPNADGTVKVEYNKTDFYNFTVSALNPQAVSSLERLSAISMRGEQRDAESLNRIQDQRERNAKIILAMLSGLSADQPTEDFWNWWPAFNDRPTGEKARTYQYAIDDSDITTLQTSISGTIADVNRVSFTARPHHGSCLVAGTLVQTSEGLKSIDSIAVGDDITSVNIETGKIALRPATLVTVRTADCSYKVSFTNGETFQASGGHYWWVVGKGWQRSRQLESGQFMRTGDSSVEIAKVEKIDQPIKVYNMIVDENHTYFVGKDRLLSWDVTSLQPTLKTAPGQSKPMYITAK